MRINFMPARRIICCLSAMIVFFGLCTLAGCGDDEEKTTAPVITSLKGTVEGKITLPSPAAGKQMYVLIDKDCDGEEYTGIAGCTCGTGTVYEYTFQNYPIGLYYVYAIVYTDEEHEGGPDPGDYFGYYNTGLEPPDLANVVILDGKTKTCDFRLYVVPN